MFFGRLKCNLLHHPLKTGELLAYGSTTIQPASLILDAPQKQNRCQINLFRWKIMFERLHISLLSNDIVDILCMFDVTGKQYVYS